MLFLALKTFSQSSSTLMGARAAGMGYSSSTLKDEWSLFNNPGGLANLKHTAASFSYDAHPNLKAFNRIAAVFAVPLKPGTGAVGIYKFGNDLYNEQIFACAFSNKLGPVALGIKANYIQYQAQGFRTKGVFTVSFGGIAQLTKHLFIGAHITNINQPTLSEEDDEKVPTRLTAGVGIQASEKFIITTEVEKDLYYDVVFKSGFEYLFQKKFKIRSGFNFNPNAAFGGFGFHQKKISIDYALAYNLNIGVNHQATVAFKINKR